MQGNQKKMCFHVCCDYVGMTEEEWKEDGAKSTYLFLFVKWTNYFVFFFLG
jgi:hypothetical protein